MTPSHQWKYHEAQKSRIGEDIGQLFTDNNHQLRTGKRDPLALPPASAADGSS